MLRIGLVYFGFPKGAKKIVIMTKKRFYLNTFIILIISVLTGCGSGDGNQKLAIKGSITLNGVPLKSGAITFIPMEQGFQWEQRLLMGAIWSIQQTEPAQGNTRLKSIPAN